MKREVIAALAIALVFSAIATLVIVLAFVVFSVMFHLITSIA